MIDKLSLKKSLNFLFQQSGFLRKGSTWLKTGADNLLMINLQKSDHGSYFYLNGGILIKSLSESYDVKINNFHIQFRLEQFLDTRSIVLNKALSLEDGDDSDLIQAIETMREVLIPILSDWETVEGLRRHYKLGTFKKSLLRWEARDFLESDRESIDISKIDL